MLTILEINFNGDLLRNIVLQCEFWIETKRRKEKMIKTGYLVVSMFLAIGFLSSSVFAQQPTPTPYVRTDAENASIEKAIDAARRDGRARVIVVFDEPFVPNSPEYIARVEALQKDLLERLVPYQITLRFLYTVIPGLALEGDEAALLVIRDSPRVRYIELDQVIHIWLPTPLPTKSRNKRIRIF
jgi:hypothetical protein